MSRLRVVLGWSVLLVVCLAVMPLTVMAEPLDGEYNDGSLTFYYPEGWAVGENYGGGVMLASTQATLDASSIPPGEVGLIVMDPATVGSLLSGSEVENTPMGLAQAFAAMIGGDESTSIGEATEQSVGDHAGARIDVTTSTGDWLILAFYVDEKNIIIVVGACAPGELSDHESTFLDIAGTVQYTAAWRAILQGHTDWVNSVVFSPDGKLIASASDDGMVIVWEAATGAQLNSLTHPDYVNGVAFSPDGLLLVSGDDDGIVRLWNVETGELVREMTGHTDYVESVAFSPDGTLIASASDDKTVRLWDAATGESRAVLEGHTDYVNNVVFSPDGKLVASASNDSTVMVWEAATGAKLNTLTHPDYVRGAAFSPDGKLIASVSNDGIVRVWDAATGESVREMTGHTDYVESVAFSPDGKLIASGSDDHTVMVWDAATGEALATLKGHSDYVNGVAFSPDGKLIASGSDDRSIRLWDVP